jgi:UDP-sugar pyrophosphorylase
VADASGHSPFPGNINILVFKMDSFVQVLEQTQGRMKEFVNPKYKDESKTSFKSPTRLECMMQDYPLLLPPSAKVGFTQLDRWLCFSAVKNNVADAAAKASKGLPAESAGSAESDAMALNARLLRLAGAQVAEAPEAQSFAGIPLRFGPMVTLLPSFGTSLSDVKARLQAPGQMKVSARSALTLEGDVVIKGRLELDGALVIRALKGAKVTPPPHPRPPPRTGPKAGL